MKYFILIADGMADFPSEQLQGRTPVEAARTPNLDRVAHDGKLGVVRTVPPDMRPDSEVSILSLLGYCPRKQPVGRAPFEAASLGVELGPQDWAFTCSLVTMDEDILIPAFKDWKGGKEVPSLFCASFPRRSLNWLKYRSPQTVLDLFEEPMSSLTLNLEEEASKDALLRWRSVSRVIT